MGVESVAEALQKVTSPESPEFQQIAETCAKLPPELAAVVLPMELSGPVEEAVLEEHPMFQDGKGPRLMDLFGYRPFRAPQAAHALVAHVLSTNDSPSQAIHWMDRVLATQSAEVTCILAVQGLHISDVVEITDSLSLVPFEQLPLSKQKLDLQDSAEVARSGYARGSPPRAALVLCSRVNPVIVPHGDKLPTNSDLASLQNMLDDALRAVALVGPCCPIPCAHWFMFNDPNLESINAYGATKNTMPDLPLPSINKPIKPASDQIKAIVRAFLNSNDSLKKRLRLSLARFHQAMCRDPAGDRALDLAISLESLLVDGPGENNYKVALRTALLHPGTRDEKVNVRRIIKLIYDLRSRLAHNGELPDTIKGKKTEEVVTQASIACATILKAVLLRGSVPDWMEFELDHSS